MKGYGIFSSALYEVRGWLRRASMCWLLFGAPLLIFGLLWLIFGTGDLRELPTAVCDRDHSTLSRQLIRWFDACPSMTVTRHINNPDEGEELLRRGEIYAYLMIPDGFERDVQRKKPVHFMGWLDGQHIAVAGILSRDITDVASSFWQQQNGDTLQQSGMPRESSRVHSTTVSLDLRPVSNPSANYRIFLMPGLLPALLQLLAGLASAFSLHHLLVEEKLPDGPPPASRCSRIVASQLALMLWFSLLGFGLEALLYLSGDLWIVTPYLMLLPAWILMACSSVAMGHMLYGAGINFLQGLGMISAWSSPAFAFAGLSFPLLTMPLFARLWSMTLPVTHFLRWQVHVAQLGADPATQYHSLISLAGMTLFYFGFGFFCSSRKKLEAPERKMAAPLDCTAPDRSLIRGFIWAGHTLIHSKAALIVMLGGVYFYSLLYPSPYLLQVPQKLPIVVVDQDRSDLSRQLTRMIDATEGASIVSVTDDPAPELEKLKGGKIQGVLLIPADFSHNLLSGGRSTLPLYCDAAYLLPYRMAMRGVKLAAENFGAGVRVERLRASGMPEKAALSLQTRGLSTLRTLYNPSGDYFLNTVPAVFVLILQQTLIIGSAVMAARSWQSRGCCPVTVGMALTGRILLLCCLYITNAFYYFWVLPHFYDVPAPPHFGQLLLFFLPFFFASALLGAAFMRVIHYPEGVFAAALPCSLPILFLSGFVWPPEAMPTLAYWLSQLIPSTPAINGYLRIMGRGATLTDVWPLWMQLWGLALLYAAPALRVNILTDAEKRKI